MYYTIVREEVPKEGGLKWSNDLKVQMKAVFDGFWVKITNHNTTIGFLKPIGKVMGIALNHDTITNIIPFEKDPRPNESNRVKSRNLCYLNTMFWILRIPPHVCGEIVAFQCQNSHTQPKKITCERPLMLVHSPL